MKLLNYLPLILLFSCNSKEAIEPIDILKKHAIQFNDLTKLNQKIYDEISDYDVIMIGEMHGTKEPAEFAFGLCNLITKTEGKVILALEITSSTMNNFSNDMSIEQLLQLDFFRGENTDGRNGEAWLDLINKCNQNKGIILKFIDNYRFSDRDSSMYVDICDISKSFPNTKIVSLTGNVHNRLKAFKSKLKFGGYLINDTINFDQKKIMSLMHVYNHGTILYKSDNGLDLATIEAKDNIYNQTISSKQFFCKRVFEDHDHYTHILYTEKVTHSDVIEIK